MISIQEADQIILKATKPFPIVERPLLKSYGAVLIENIKADRDMPPFDKSLMDGLAIRIESYKKGNRKFLVEGTQSAGIPALSLKFADSCTEIMTGAVLSEGCDTVIPIEDVTIQEGKALVKDGLALKKGQFIRSKGSDHKKGEILIPKGNILGPVQIATVAAVGAAQVKVSAKPSVAIISSGDELVDLDVPVEPYQIRKSNSYFIQAALEKTQLFDTALFHFKDNLKVLIRQIGAIIERYDVLVLTGGVSMGKFDLIPQAMKELKVKVLFHKVQQKPGKPFWFGISSDGKPVFALPGNPVSTQMGTYRYVIPSLQRALGLEPAEEFVQLNEEFTPDTPLTFFCPVKLEKTKDAILTARPQIFKGSGDFASLALSDGFIEIPSGTKVIKPGTTARFYRW
ncbi:MAG: molybdopterin molybdotransferase MoeA [Candidatus Omnitrophica bacterium]|nr:molybdopterin molybdotransferase MoeA [Candidatus Omnitrophota bacterium]